MRSYLRCRSCKGPLSAILTHEVTEGATNVTKGEPFVAAGSVHLSRGSYYTGTDGQYIINLADRRKMTAHSDPRRLAGCCGLDGCDGPNQLCACGAEVATEKSDCWMPHSLIFVRAAVDLVEAD